MWSRLGEKSQKIILLEMEYFTNKHILEKWSMSFTIKRNYVIVHMQTKRLLFLILKSKNILVHLLQTSADNLTFSKHLAYRSGVKERIRIYHVSDTRYICGGSEVSF